MRLASAVLLAFACLLTGYSFSLSLKKRRDCLNSFEKAIAVCRREIGYKSTGRAKILSILISDNLPELDAYLTALCGGKKDPSLLAQKLTDEEKALITEFFDGLGASDTDSQLAMCKIAGEKCAEYLKSAEKRYETLSALYMYISAAAAIMLAILLL